MKYLKKIRLYTGYLFFLFVLFLAKPVILSYWIGLFIVLSGEAIRTWAAGCIEKDKNLAKTGPYRLVRNPLYLGSFFIGLGVAIISCSSSFLLAFVLLFLSVYLPTIFREEKFLAEKFTDDYLNYQKDVPPFFPLKLHPHLPPPPIPSSLILSPGGRGREGEGGRTFSWKRVRRNKEFHTWIAVFVILLILGLKM